MVADAVLRNQSPTRDYLVTGENTGVRLFLLVNREGRNVVLPRKGGPSRMEEAFEPKIRRGGIRT